MDDGGQDIAVSAVSGVSSTLLVPATFLLGFELGGPLVGLPAAFLVSLDPDLVSWSTMGFRDDFFALATVVFVWTCLVLTRSPSRLKAIAVGIAGAAACLTRITSFSFVVPTLVLLVCSPGAHERRGMLRLSGIAAVVAAALLAPFLIDCWLRFGDPLFAINWVTGFYLSKEAGAQRPPTGIVPYLLDHSRSETLHSVDTLMRGMTVYPWANKWEGLAKHCSSWLAGCLKVLCIPGLLLWLWSRRGLLVLTALAGSLLPFAVTWELYPEWRFTLHAVPFLIVAVVSFICTTLATLHAWVRERGVPWAEARIVAQGTLASAALFLIVSGAMYALSTVMFVDDLAEGKPAALVAGDRDWFYFARSWSAARREGNVPYRYVDGREGTILVPLARGGAFDCVLRMDPVPTDRSPDAAVPPLDLELEINGDWRQDVQMRYDPHRVGQHSVEIPPGVLQPGINRIELRALPSDTSASMPRGASAFRLWYLRLAPR